MLEFIEILLIAALQGIGEFLPISSSGHNAVANHLFTQFGKPLTNGSADFIKLNVLLHLGTLFAVIIVFRQRIVDLFTKDFRMIPLLIVGTIPGVIVGLIVKKTCPWIEESLPIIATCFIATGILLIGSLFLKNGEKTCSTMTYADALLIGIVQGIAVLPGISRSGSTIVAGLFRRLEREEAATFSFLLSIPIIAGGGILELKDLLDPELAANGSLPPWLLLVAVFVSCAVGVVSLLWVIDWLKKGHLWYFAVWVFLMSPFTFWLATLPQPAEKPTQEPGVVQEKASDAATLEKTQPIPSAHKHTPLGAMGRPLIDPATGKLESTTSVRKLTAPTPEEPKPEPTAESTLTKAVEKEDAEPSGRLNMSREEALKEYEKIRAEEEAKEQALIDEENKRVPLVGKPDTLIPLDPKQRIWLTKDGESVVLLGRVALREGLLELLACRVGSKEHESIISIRVKPMLIHAALLAIGAEPGKPVQVHPTFVPPSGDEIEIKVRWRDENGDVREILAQEWVLDNAKSTKDDPQAMSTHWVFTGSKEFTDEDGERHYVAEETGELFGVSNFVGAILDVPIKSSSENADLLFSCFTERIPEVGTPLTIILTPTKNRRE